MAKTLEEKLDEFVKLRDTATPSLQQVTLAIREKTARRALHIKKKDPLVYKGLTLRCIGSKAWRYANSENPQRPAA